ncbi:hypothetical protein KMW28_27175 [Flammeovirga yaeyamensis]|uniref:Uncharacterized protein n=1 Tax=Flammeovirga yaeyamensis TaxID=367791 RepID=A0AAX1NF13_9BACT|nr:hypothetical protein [Flammeovirga yaeyamensis]MBB3700037.1 hypothetical protein [Flammeovirga yaeyamensis]NMF37526.1 hypothetical protein [Flammeovirga yaeyamensis]QWG04583.1 hypothetical protein KMW28_27175 [Flammeovirga yaeyamensis]
MKKVFNNIANVELKHFENMSEVLGETFEVSVTDGFVNFIHEDELICDYNIHSNELRLLNFDYKEVVNDAYMNTRIAKEQEKKTFTDRKKAMVICKEYESGKKFYQTLDVYVNDIIKYLDKVQSHNVVKKVYAMLVNLELDKDDPNRVEKFYHPHKTQASV